METVGSCPFCGCKDQIEIIPASSSQFLSVVEAILSGIAQGGEHVTASTQLDQLSSEEVENAFRQHLANDDFRGAGNLILDLLMRPDQEHSPNTLCQRAENSAKALVNAYFRMAKALAYERPHRDVHLPWHKRGDWSADRFPQLIIDAYVLGATRVNLGPPHHLLVPYYRLMAQRQTKSIQEVHKTWQERRNSPNEVEEILNNDDPEVSPEAKLRAVKDRLGVPDATNHGVKKALPAPEV